MQKEQILSVLQNHKGEFISGQTLCEILGVSRTSIWKHISALKEEGYQIDAVTKKGYCLVGDSYIYNAYEIKKALEIAHLDMDVRFEKCVDSTNDWAFSQSKEHENLLFVAEEQLLGKGRRGRVWVSPPGYGIWMSYLMKPKIKIENAPMLTLIFALAVAHAIQALYQLDIQIKWPNDIVYNGKKICGILTEMRSDTDGIKAVVCGIGINANMLAFPKDLETATSIRMECGAIVDRTKLIARIMEYFSKYYDIFQKTQDLSMLKDAYETILVSKNQEVCILEDEKKMMALCKGITTKGELIVLDGEQREMRIHSGEVSVRGVYGYI